MHVFALTFLSVYVKTRGGGTLEEASFLIQRDIHILWNEGRLGPKKKGKEESKHQEENSQCCEVQALLG